MRTHGRNDGLARPTVESTSAIVCRLEEVRKCCTAVALQSSIVRECAERCNNRLDAASSAGFVCVVE
jgi:hypothetical protein